MLDVSVEEWFEYEAIAWSLDESRTLVAWPKFGSSSALVIPSELATGGPWPEAPESVRKHAGSYLETPPVLRHYCGGVDPWLKWASRRAVGVASDGERWADWQRVCDDERFAVAFNRKLIREAMQPFLQLDEYLVCADLLNVPTSKPTSAPLLRFVGHRITTVVMSAVDCAIGTDPFAARWERGDAPGEGSER